MSGDLTRLATVGLEDGKDLTHPHHGSECGLDQASYARINAVEAEVHRQL
jgi:hypothetical protein